MKTNSHILAIDTYLGEMRGMVRALENNPAKEALMNLVQAMTDEVFEAHADFTEMNNKIADLHRQLYEPIVRAQAGEQCRYIDVDALNKSGVYTLEDFEKKLRKACESDARVLAVFLRKYEKIGYLDFHSENKKRILAHLQECFPTMKQYGYPNFAAAF